MANVVTLKKIVALADYVNDSIEATKSNKHLDIYTDFEDASMHDIYLNEKYSSHGKRVFRGNTKDCYNFLLGIKMVYFD